jgi:hypothetical protein
MAAPTLQRFRQNAGVVTGVLVGKTARGMGLESSLQPLTSSRCKQRTFVPSGTNRQEPIVAPLARAVKKARANGAPASAGIVPGRSERRRRELLETRLRELSDEEIDMLLTKASAHRPHRGVIRRLMGRIFDRRRDAKPRTD